ncbi:hypothetical protein LTR49_026377, partial [Elasticomyces elasticus]
AGRIAARTDLDNVLNLRGFHAQGEVKILSYIKFKPFGTPGRKWPEELSMMKDSIEDVAFGYAYALHLLCDLW